MDGDPTLTKTAEEIFIEAENEVFADAEANNNLDTYFDPSSDDSQVITNEEATGVENAQTDPTNKKQAKAIADGTQTEIFDVSEDTKTAEEAKKFNPFATPEVASKVGSKKLTTPAVNPLYDTLDNIATESETGRAVRVLDIINAIQKNKQTTKFEAVLAKRLEQAKVLLEGVKVRFVDPADMDDNVGSYIETVGGERVITLARSNNANDGRNNQTFLHEALHAATARIIAQYKENSNNLPIKQQKAIANLENLMLETGKRIDKKKADATITEEETFFNDAGAFSDVSEFVSYGMSHPAMQEILAKMPAVNNKYGKLGEFIRSIKEIFNFPVGVNNAFDELVIVSDRLLNITKKDFSQISPVNIKLNAKVSATERTARRKLEASKSPRAFLDAMKAVFAEKTITPAINLLLDAKNSITIPALKFALYTLPTQTVIDLGTRMYSLKGLKRLQTAVRRVGGDRTRRMMELAIKADMYGKFIRKFGPALNRALSDSMSLSTIFNINGSVYATEAQALRLDAQIIESRTRQADQSLTPNQRKAAKAAETKRKTELKIFYKGTKVDKDYPLGFIGWEQLNKDTQGEATKIYNMVKETYQQNFKEYYASLQKKIKDSDSLMEEGKTNVLAQIQKEMLDQMESGVYFPLVRFGDYYIGNGTGASRTFEMFESATERNARIRELATKIKNDNPQDTRTINEIANSEEFSQIGDTSRNLRDELEKGGKSDAGELLRNIFSAIDKNTSVNPATNAKTFSDINAIKNEIYQLYINTLPEQSMRKRFTKRKGTAGFSGDAFRIFLSTNHQAANQLSKVKHNDAMRGAIASAYDELQGRGGQDLLRARAYVDRVVTRALDDVGGDPLEGKLMERVVRFGNQAAFFYYLTSAKSALVQLTQLPVVGMPILAAKFGSAKAFGMMVKMLPVGNTLMARKMGEDGELRFAAKQTSLKESKFVLELPDDLKMFAFEAIDAADALDIFNATYATESAQRSRVPTQGYHSTLGSGVRMMGNFMSGAFHHSERWSRQIMFMSSYRLSMEQQMESYEQELSKLMETNQGMTRAQAVDALYAPYKGKTAEINKLMAENNFLVSSGRYTKEDAVSELLAKDKNITSPRKAARRAMLQAIDLSYEALFDYGQFNKPEILKGRGNMAFLRIPAQFLTFPINMTVFMGRNFYTMLPFIKGNVQKREAAIKFFGAQGMAFLFGGATGMWQYSSLMGVLEGMREMFRPEGEEEDEWYDDDDDGNPLGKRNLDLWFREWFIPKHFGPDSSLAKTFGLTDEQAKMLQRSVKLGPVSALTGLNIGASTSLDGLFFTKGKGIEDLEDIEEIMLEKLYGPAGSLFFKDLPKGVKLIAKGEFLEGAEKLMPAFFKGAIKSIRYEKEGLRTSKDFELKSAEYYTAGKLLGTTLGFNVTEVAEIREALFEAKNLIEQIKTERNGLLKAYDEVYNSYLRDSSPANESRVVEKSKEIAAYNVRNGQAGVGISNGDLRDSLKGRAKARFNAELTGGLMVGSPTEYKALLPLLRNSGVLLDE